MDFPDSFTEMIGKEYTWEGGLFSAKKSIEPMKMKVLKLRWSYAYFTRYDDNGNFHKTHPGIEFLVKGEGMKRSRWTRPFPCREYRFKDGGHDLEINPDF